MTKSSELLGYGPDDRVLIIHADDVGFCHASNAACFEAMIEGSLTCGSVLVPAPWFAETAEMQRQHPQADLGVHLTLNCEYGAYRWRSLTGASPLHDADGGMWRTVEQALECVPAEAGAAELRAQVELALANGIDVTHLDTHMGTAMHPRFLPAYVDLAFEFRLPLFFIRPSDRRLTALGDSADAYSEQAARLDALGWPLLDNIIIKTLMEIEPEQKEARFRETFAALRPGLTHFLVHPAQPTDELQAITPESWRNRAADYQAFRSPAMREYCEGLGIKLTGYREIRDRLRAALG